VRNCVGLLQIPQKQVHKEVELTVLRMTDEIVCSVHVCPASTVGHFMGF
jgi:hypothetical protein